MDLLWKPGLRAPQNVPYSSFVYFYVVSSNLVLSGMNPGYKVQNLD